MFIKRVFCGTQAARPRWRGPEVLPCPSSLHLPSMALSSLATSTPYTASFSSRPYLPALCVPTAGSSSQPSFLPGGRSGQLKTLLSHGGVETKCVSHVIPLPTPSKLAAGLGDP